MRLAVLLSLLLGSLSAYADEIRWDDESRRLADIDCDGKADEVIIGFLDSGFQLRVTPSTSRVPSTINFGLGDPTRQDGLCGTEVEVALYQTDQEALEEEFGEAFEGYRSVPGCVDISLRGGDCDSINVFWNHETRTLNWWRR